MKKSTTGIQKLRGRPKSGQTPIHALRLPEELRTKIDAWIAAQPEPRPSRSEAIRRLLAEALGHAVAEPATPSETVAAGMPSAYSAIRVASGRAVDEWQGRAPDDESAAHRLGQHLKTKLDQKIPGYGPDDLVTLTRPDGEIVTVAHIREMIERLKGWKTSPSDDHDIAADE
jgi:Arc/MetJ-type ribon-helix-helix transcriptional regulator